MKKSILHILFCAILLTGLPMIPALAVRSQEDPAEIPQDMPEFVEFTMEETEPVESAAASTETEIFPVLDVKTGEIMEVSVRDYVIGAVCAEMPASFEPEALKAQAVAAHTYARRLALLAGNTSDESLNGAYFSNDPAKYQAFYTNAEIREAYGEHYEEYYAKVSAAADAVLGEILVYEDAPIIAAFHAMSSGRTESAEYVWGSAVSYLTPVDSSSDREAPLFEQSAVFTAQELQEILKAARPDILFSGEPETWLSVPECTESGTVLQLRAGSSIFTGQEIRTLFSLRSAAFSVSYADGSFTFTTQGYGHNVGMSQYGANAMAQEGKTYREILSYYYSGAELREISGTVNK